MESIVSQQVFAAWVQTAGVVAAAIVAALIYALHSYRASRRARLQARQLVDRVLVLAQQIRKLFHKGELACTPAGTVAAAGILAAFESERQCLCHALVSLPLEHTPDAALFKLVLKLKICLTQMGEGLNSATPADARQLFRRLHQRADTAIGRIDALRKLHFEKPRFPLKRRSEVGMPTTTVDRYAAFEFMEEIYLEPDSIDFEVLVNNQSVRCTISHKELDRLAEEDHLRFGSDFRRHATIFKRQREMIYLAAEYLIRAGARSPVEVRCADVHAVRSAPPSHQRVPEVGGLIS